MNKKILFIIILCTYSLNAYAQHNVPKDNRYWKFHQWYVSHSVLSLVVNGKDEQHLSEALNEISKLKNRGVLVGDVMIIGGPKDLNKLSALTKNAGLDSNLMENAQAVVDKLEITNSPTWIVRYRGKDYVYEGLRSAQGLFTSQGQFKGDE